MHYGAISTDIKKSSSNWGLFPVWMENAVILTNNITEYVFNTYKISGTDATQMILANSPEGDAYTMFYTHHNKNELENHMKDIALKIQYLLNEVRYGKPSTVPPSFEPEINGYGMPVDEIRKELKEQLNEELWVDGDETKEENETPSHERIHSIIEMYQHLESKYDYIGNVYLRIGIATDTEPPIPYTYNGMDSYRGGVIDLSETAEQNAPYKNGYGMYNHETKLVDKVEEDLASANAEALTSNSDIWETLTKKSQQSETVRGHMVFIHYNFGITEEMLETNPHLMPLVKQEFRALHDETYKRLSELEGCLLVKVKRDSSSMYYFNWGTVTEFKKVGLFTTCCGILSMLPYGSSIGICYSGDKKYGRLKQVQRDGKPVDFFGPAVNMAARMEFIDWSYPTATGITITSTHENRIAYGSWEADQWMYTNKRGGNRETGKSALVNYPFKMDRIPAETLNAGYGEFIYVLSKKVHGRNEFKVGDSVKWENMEGVIVGIDIFRARIKTKSGRILDVKVRKLSPMGDGGNIRDEADQFLKSIEESALYKLKF